MTGVKRAGVLDRNIAIIRAAKTLLLRTRFKLDYLLWNAVVPRKYVTGT